MCENFIKRCNEIWKNGEIVSCPTVPFDQYKIGVKMLLPLNIPAFQNAVVRGEYSINFLDKNLIAKKNYSGIF